MQIDKYGFAKTEIPQTLDVEKQNKLSILCELCEQLCEICVKFTKAMKSIFNKTQTHFNAKLPFVIYKKPNELCINGIFQKTTELFLINNFTEKGFAFCSFDGTINYIIPENQSEIIKEEVRFEDTIFASNSLKNNDTAEKQNFEKLVSDGIDAIQQNKFKKVVLSRTEIIELSDFDIIKIFSATINIYPTAFSYCFYHPQIGLWMGASPEQFLQVTKNKFSTVALAGTQKAEGQNLVIWQEKERQEQQFVTDYIKENLEQIGLRPEISEPFTTQAGNLLHLKTIINVNIIKNDKFNSNFNLEKIIKILHPTPAVCGLPKQEAKEFILKSENYKREFYTGFMGELNLGNTTDLFVNLRCMQLYNTTKPKQKWTAKIYVGCGITKNSIPENEWFETVNKSFTMLNLF